MFSRLESWLSFGRQHVFRWTPRGCGGDNRRRAATLRPAPWPRGQAKSIGHCGSARRGVYVTEDPRGLVALRISNQDRVGIRFEKQGALSWEIRKRPSRGLLVPDMPTGTFDATTPPTLRATTTAPVGRSTPSRRRPFPRLNAAPPRAHPTRGPGERASAALAAPRGTLRCRAGVADDGLPHARPRRSRGEGLRGCRVVQRAEEAPPLGMAGPRGCCWSTGRSSLQGTPQWDTSRPSRSPWCSHGAPRGRTQRPAPTPRERDPMTRGQDGLKPLRGYRGAPRGRKRRCGYPRSCPGKGRPARQAARHPRWTILRRRSPPRKQAVVTHPRCSAPPVQPKRWRPSPRRHGRTRVPRGSPRCKECRRGGDPRRT